MPKESSSARVGGSTWCVLAGRAGTQEEAMAACASPSVSRTLCQQGVDRLVRLNAPLNGLAPLLLLLIAATRDGVAQRPTSTVRDSAGIVIVANSSPLTSPVMFRIGGPAFDPESPGHGRTGMSNSNLRGIRLPDGRIVVVADALEGAPVAGLPTPTSSAGLRFLDPRGQPADCRTDRWRRNRSWADQPDLPDLHRHPRGRHAPRDQLAFNPGDDPAPSAHRKW